MVLDAGETALPWNRQIRLDVVIVEIKSNIPVEIAVTRVARVALVLAPNLFGRIEVASKSRQALRGKDGGKNAVARARPAMEQPMRLHEEPAQVGFLERLVDFRNRSEERRVGKECRARGWVKE